MTVMSMQLVRKLCSCSRSRVLATVTVYYDKNDPIIYLICIHIYNVE